VTPANDVKLVEQLVRLGKGIIKAIEEWLREQRNAASSESQSRRPEVTKE
jgi:hypothetical protein